MEKAAPDMFQSNEEPRRGLEPLRIGLIEDRFEYLSGKTLMKEEKIVQRYRFLPMKADASQMLTGLGTGQGTWGASNLQLTKLTTVQSPVQKRQDVPVLPASLETFVQAIELLAEQRRPCEVGLIGVGQETRVSGHTLWQVSRPMIRARGRESHGLGSKKRTAQDMWLSPRSAQEIRSHTRSKSSGPIRSTPFSSRAQGLAKDRHRRIAVVAADVRYEAWLGIGRSDAGISTQDHNPPGTGWHFCIGIANLEEDRGNV